MASEEIILLERTLWVTFHRDQLSRAFAGLSVSTNPPAYLPESGREIAYLSANTVMENLTLIDSILMERFGIPGTNILVYATDCVYRIADALGKKWAVTSETTKRLLEYVRKMLINYVGIALSTPEMFPEQSPEHPSYEGVQLGAFRLKEFILTAFQPDVFKELMEYWERENPEFRSQITQNVLMQVFESAESSRGDHSAILSLTNTCHVLLQNRELAATVMALPNWIVGSKQGIYLELRSAISPLFSPTWFSSLASAQKIPGHPPPRDPIRDKVSATLERIRTKGEYNAQVEYYLRSQREVTDSLTELMKALLKVNKEPVLNWLAEAVMGNAERTKEGRRLARAQQTLHSSDGFCFNVLDVLLNLCLPFLDPNDPKAQKIDPLYLLSPTARLKLQNETCICTKPQSDPIPSPSAPFGTITEFYFLCLCMFHYAWHGARNSFTDLSRLINDLRKKKDELHEQESKYYMKVVYGHDIMLMDPGRNRNLMRFCALTMSLFTKWSGFDGRHLPLPSPPNMFLRGFPEFMIEDIAEFLLLLLEMRPEIYSQWTNEECEIFAVFMTITLSSSAHLTNPYLRAKQVQMLSHMVEGKTSLTTMQGILQWNEIVRMYFLEYLVQFYVDIETTGAHNQFYEKFGYRHYATRIFMFLWRYEHYQQQTVSLQSSDYFVRFINMLMNDTTFLFDESIAKLTEVKKLEVVQMERPLTPEETKSYDHAADLCKYYFLQTNEAVEKIEKLTEWDKDVFLKEGFNERFSAMLNYILVNLCGPRCLELKVKNMEAYNFKPIELLAGVVRCYNNLSHDEAFLKAIVKDQRSYSHEVMQKALRILGKRLVVQHEERLTFEKMVSSLKDLSTEQESLEELLGEIPDEFVCPISCELMRNPVKLPSGTICERATIERHLLNEQNDPFNRQPLTLDQVVDDPEMKAKIDAWIQSKLGH